MNLIKNFRKQLTNKVIPHSLIILLLLVSCNNKKNTATIRGNIRNTGHDVIYIDNVDLYETSPLDTIKIRSNGKFRIRIKTGEPGFYQLRLPDNHAVNLLVQPGEEISFTADGKKLLYSASVSGSPGSRQIIQLNKNLAKTVHRLDSIRERYAGLSASPGTDHPRHSLSLAYDSTFNSHYKYSVAFVLYNYNSLASIMALFQKTSSDEYVFNKVRDLQYFKIVADSLSKLYPDLHYVKALKENYKRLYGQYQTQRIMSMSKDITYTVPDIALPSITGDTIRLSDLKGKYVLLSFWASWNEKSISNNLKMKPVYEKFRKKGFEIYQVSFDKSYESWERSIRYDELPWIHVCDTSFPASRIASTYNIRHLPANFLISKDYEEVLAKNISPDRLQTRLSELLN